MRVAKCATPVAAAYIAFTTLGAVALGQLLTAPLLDAAHPMQRVGGAWPWIGVLTVYGALVAALVYVTLVVEQHELNARQTAVASQAQRNARYVAELLAFAALFAWTAALAAAQCEHTALAPQHASVLRAVQRAPVTTDTVRAIVGSLAVAAPWWYIASNVAYYPVVRTRARL